MPIHAGQDKKGHFYQWGSTGKKYYFDPDSKRSVAAAYNRAEKQQTAIYSSGWKGDEEMKIKLLRVVKNDVSEIELQKMMKRSKVVREVSVIEERIVDSFNRLGTCGDYLKKVLPLCTSFPELEKHVQNLIKAVAKSRAELIAVANPGNRVEKFK